MFKLPSAEGSNAATRFMTIALTGVLASGCASSPNPDGTPAPSAGSKQIQCEAKGSWTRISQGVDRQSIASRLGVTVAQVELGAWGPVHCPEVTGSPDQVVNLTVTVTSPDDRLMDHCAIVGFSMGANSLLAVCPIKPVEV